MIDIIIQRYDRQLLIYLGILAIVGTVMLYSASWYESFASSNGRTDMLFLQGHLKRMLVGVFFSIWLYNVRLSKIKRNSTLFINCRNRPLNCNKSFLSNKWSRMV